ncbi:hypothetical protein Dip518_000193 [Parelusimicrobium proximum]|uniref:hypothetical protein n=1 Tax=Parelusimicrobium proximum TaxID=3228953 RepID=UPI003D1702AB
MKNTDNLWYFWAGVLLSFFMLITVFHYLGHTKTLAPQQAACPPTPLCKRPVESANFSMPPIGSESSLIYKTNRSLRVDYTVFMKDKTHRDVTEHFCYTGLYTNDEIGKFTRLITEKVKKINPDAVNVLIRNVSIE